jgi:hypothetical protein
LVFPRSAFRQTAAPTPLSVPARLPNRCPRTKSCRL